jgi:hypothetical protein
MDNVIARINADQKLRGVFGTFNNGIDIKAIDASIADRQRVFVSPLAWALFEAYRSVILQAVAISKMLEVGINPFEALQMEKIKNLVANVLPSYADLLEKHELFALNASLEPLQKMILDQIKSDLQNTSETKENAQRALEIIRVVDEIKVSQMAT